MAGSVHTNIVGRWMVLSMFALSTSFAPIMSLAQTPESVKQAMATLKAKTAQ